MALSAKLIAKILLINAGRYAPCGFAGPESFLPQAGKIDRPENFLALNGQEYLFTMTMK